MVVIILFYGHFLQKKSAERTGRVPTESETADPDSDPVSKLGERVGSEGCVFLLLEKYAVCKFLKRAECSSAWEKGAKREIEENREEGRGWIEQNGGEPRTERGAPDLNRKQDCQSLSSTPSSGGRDSRH